MRFLTYHLLDWAGASHLRCYGAEVELFTYVWLAASMGVAYLAKIAERTRAGKCARTRALACTGCPAG